LVFKKRAGEFLDGAMHQCGRADVLAHQSFVERALADDVGGFAAKRIIAALFHWLTQAVQNSAKRPLAGAVAEETVVVLQLDVEAVHVYRRQAGSAVPADADGGHGVLSHFALPMPELEGQQTGNPLVSRLGRRGAAARRRPVKTRQFL
jgi:hypothetical protein